MTQKWQKNDPLPRFSTVSYALSSPYPRWSLLSLQTSDVQEAIAQSYLSHCNTPLLLKKPSIVLIEEKKGSIFFAFFDLLDGLHLQSFDRSHLQKLHAFDEGFGGYATEIELSLASHPEQKESRLSFQTPLSFSISPLPPTEKWEERIPAIALKIKEGESEEEIALLYDGENRGLRWPILGGKYQIKFEPCCQHLPFFVTLRQAHTLTYPDSSQVYSYEADLVIEQKGKLPFKTSISMNHPVEISPGYRLFLSAIASSRDAKKKQARFTVTYDPVKYVLTYPGAFFLMMGGFLLFFGSKKGSKH